MQPDKRIKSRLTSLCAPRMYIAVVPLADRSKNSSLTPSEGCTPPTDRSDRPSPSSSVVVSEDAGSAYHSIHTRPRKHALEHTDDTTPARHHEIDPHRR